MPCCMCSPCHGKKIDTEKATKKKNTLVVESTSNQIYRIHSYGEKVPNLACWSRKIHGQRSFRMIHADALSTPWQQEAELWTLQAQVDHLGFQDVVCSQCRQHFRGRRFANRIVGS